MSENQAGYGSLGPQVQVAGGKMPESMYLELEGLAEVHSGGDLWSMLLAMARKGMGIPDYEIIQPEKQP